MRGITVASKKPHPGRVGLEKQELYSAARHELTVGRKLSVPLLLVAAQKDGDTKTPAKSRRQARLPAPRKKKPQPDGWAGKNALHSGAHRGRGRCCAGELEFAAAR